ncbi:MAG: lysylphosphatidylglycerol synthase transmembrane domain-containing protein [Gemmatimonadaceae bacterium]
MPNKSTATIGNNRRMLWRWLQIVFLVVALAYAAKKVSEQWSELATSAANLHPNWITLSLATLIVLVTYGALIQSWRILVAGWGSELRFFPAVRIWTIANLGRYIPGKVWSVGALGILAQREGVSPTAAAGSAILGTLLNIGAGFGVVAFSSSQILNSVSNGVRFGSIVISVLSVVGVIAAPWILPPISKWLAKKLGRDLPERHLSAPTLWAAVTINLLSWFGYGAAFMLFSKACLPSIGGSFTEFVGVWTASYLVGYIVFFAPGGIGAREGAMVAAFTALGLTSQAEAWMLAFASRLWLTILELLPGLVGLALSRKARSAHASPNTDGKL